MNHVTDVAARIHPALAERSPVDLPHGTARIEREDFQENPSFSSGDNHVPAGGCDMAVDHRAPEKSSLLPVVLLCLECEEQGTRLRVGPKRRAGWPGRCWWPHPTGGC